MKIRRRCYVNFWSGTPGMRVRRARAGPALARLEEGFRRDSFSYVLFLRFVPIFPSWLVSSVAAQVQIQIQVQAQPGQAPPA